MAQKAENYKDKSGNSWLVFYDKDGDSNFDIWTTNRLVVVPTKVYLDKQYGIQISIEVLLFPNNKWGFGYQSHCIDHMQKTQCCIASGNAFDTELEAYQKALLHIKNQVITFKFKDEVKKLIQEIEKDLIPSTLF